LNRQEVSLFVPPEASVWKRATKLRAQKKLPERTFKKFQVKFYKTEINSRRNDQTTPDIRTQTGIIYQNILGLQSFPRESKDKDMAAMLVP
jgi:hypothetical protein